MNKNTQDIDTQDFINKLEYLKKNKKIHNTIVANKLEIDIYKIKNIVQGKSSVDKYLIDSLHKHYRQELSTYKSTNDLEFLPLSYKPNVRLYEINASAGGLIAAQNADGSVADEWYIPDILGEHIAVNVSGVSMSPTMHDGDKIIAKEVYRNDLRDGKIYIVVTADNNVRVKRLRMDSEVLMLWSDNIAYVPRYERLYLEEVIKLYCVVMVCKLV